MKYNLITINTAEATPHQLEWLVASLLLDAEAPVNDYGTFVPWKRVCRATYKGFLFHPLDNPKHLLQLQQIYKVGVFPTADEPDGPVRWRAVNGVGNIEEEAYSFLPLSMQDGKDGSRYLQPEAGFADVIEDTLELAVVRCIVVAKFGESVKVPEIIK